MWAMRIVHESTLYTDNCFLTLTYRDEADATPEQRDSGYYLPPDGSLHKSHFQKFIKRLRKANPKRTIRYFHCGEYGDESDRPHYHACLFNIDFDDLVLYRSDEGINTYSSPTLEKLWPYGFSTVGELNFDTAAYTARYCLKKITGPQAEDHYLRSDENGVAYWLQPEYVTMSLKPGIGRRWYDTYKDDIFPADETPVPGKGIVSKVPRYYENVLAAEDPDQLELIKQMRKKFILEHLEDFTPERIMDKYKVQIAKLKTNQRNKI